MGLDMYLSRKTYVKRWDHQDDDVKFMVTVEQGGMTYPHIDPDNVSDIIEQVAYWRKANQIHAWFVRNVQDGQDDCASYLVEPEELETLHRLCKQVLRLEGENQLKCINATLPPQDGFFFSATSHLSEEDALKYYLQDIEETVSQLAPLLEDIPKHASGLPLAEYSYQSSW